MRRKKLISEAKEGKPQRFITLTVNPAWFNSPEERAQKLVEAWRKIRRRFLDLSENNKCEFLAVFELTQLGEPHLHIVQRGSFIPQKWLSEQMKELMGAPVVDIRSVTGSKEVAKYISKYISKRNIKIGTLKRYWRSVRYLKVSRRELRARRNAGCRFFIMENHWKRLMVEVLERQLEVSEITKYGMKFKTLYEDDYPPWCLNIEPIYAKAVIEKK